MKSIQTCLLFCGLSAAGSIASDSIGQTTFDGITRDITVDSVQFEDGTGALKILNADKPSSKAFDYLVMLWMKPQDPTPDAKEWLIDSPQDFNVYFTGDYQLIARPVDDNVGMQVSTAEL
jgi:hypothetical protein